MDEREAMSSSSYYLHQGISPPAFRQVPNHPPGVGPAFDVVHPSPSEHHGGNAGGGIAGLSSSGELAKKKRGRPQKYGPDGNVSLTLSHMSSTPPGTSPVSGFGSGSGSHKRGRGRPPGTGRKQQLASLGEWVSGSAGMGFTPHVISIPIGEDIAAKIMSFSQQGPRGICILSANGAVSTVTLRQPASSGGTITYEGRFEILSLSGSFLLTDEGGSRSRSGGLSISLSNPNGRVLGGGVGGLLIAASPVQVMVGSFMYRGAKPKSKPKTDPKTGAESEEPQAAGDKPVTMPIQSLGPPTVMGGWSGLRQGQHLILVMDPRSSMFMAALHFLDDTSPLFRSSWGECTNIRYYLELSTWSTPHIRHGPITAFAHGRTSLLDDTSPPLLPHGGTYDGLQLFLQESEGSS